MGGNLSKANQLITKSADELLNNIKRLSENGPYRRHRKISSTFSMLNLCNDAFYEYAYFERSLDRCVGEMINAIFDDLFALRGIKLLPCTETEKLCLCNTASVEEYVPFEFIIPYCGERIGVRYTSLANCEVLELKRKYNVSKIVHLSWKKKARRVTTTQEVYEVLTPKEFFARYFSIEEYNIFMKKISRAIDSAKSEIGFKTIANLSPRNLANFKSEILTFLLDTSFEKIKYQALEDSKEKMVFESMTFSSEDYEILSNNFQKAGLYKALVGNEGFAKCFITAEYLYSIFADGHEFDYTSVVCGYLKSVEQLLYKLMKIRLNYHTGEDLWIKCKSLKKAQRAKLCNTIRPNPAQQSNSTQILFKKENEPFFDITLTPLIWFVHDDLNGWNVSDNARTIITSFLLNFSKECRNDHFHKDNIDIYDEVSRIRNNTLLITYLLLGGYVLTGNQQQDFTDLGIYNDSFDRMYKQILNLPSFICKFIIYFDGRNPVKAYRLYRQDAPNYDRNGAVSQSTIKFVAVDSFCSKTHDSVMQGKFPQREFALSRENMPQKISYINGRNEEVFLNDYFSP